MRRRRFFRTRRVTGSYANYPIAGRPMQALQRAHRLMENGEHVNAAVIYERLAREGLDLGFARQSPFLLLQAGRAQFLAGHSEAGAVLLREAMALLAAAGRWRVVRNAGQRMVQELENIGQFTLAAEISSWLKAALPSSEIAQTASQAAPEAARLPMQCPHCGAPVRSNELEWQNPRTAECSYCGGVIRAGE